jgi:hypothetical protein
MYMNTDWSCSSSGVIDVGSKAADEAFTVSLKDKLVQLCSVR